MPDAARPPAPSAAGALEVADLVRRYGRETVLDGITWRVEPGHVVGVLGRNGAGKSTLLHCALGLLKAHAGTCRVLGDDARRLSDGAKERLGFVAQVPQLPSWPTVRRLIVHHRAFYPRWNDDLVRRLLERFEIPGDKRISALSLGQQQGLALTIALAPEPDLLVLDEPAASLDPVARRTFQDAILEVALDGRRAVVLSSHLTSDIERVCDRVLFLRRGRVAFDGDLGELKSAVKRLRIAAPRPLAGRPAIPGLLGWEAFGDRAIATIQAVDPQAAARQGLPPGCEIQVEDLGLEDIVVELHR